LRHYTRGIADGTSHLLLLALVSILREQRCRQTQNTYEQPATLFHYLSPFLLLLSAVLLGRSGAELLSEDFHFGSWVANTIHPITSASQLFSSFHLDKSLRLQTGPDLPLWHRALSRRSQNGRILWDRMRRLITRWLPMPAVCHPFPLRRMGVIT
jgi:hypothetical protein